VARIGFSDSPTASGIVAAWRARPELLGGTAFPITKSVLILLFWFLCPLNSSAMPLQKRRVQLELSKQGSTPFHRDRVNRISKALRRKAALNLYRR
jgi:hypothetical protein